MASVTVVIPVYNEEPIIGRVVAEARKVLNSQDEVLVVDDGSTDKTADVARQAGARVVSHPYNVGNGAAVKTGIRHARGEVLILMDGDGQHRAEDIPRLLSELDRYDLVVGARSRTSQKNLTRHFANQAYNLIASYLTNMRIMDLTSGFRAIRRNLARRFVYLLPNRFSYPTTMTLAILKAGYSLKYVPITTSPRVGKSRLRFFRDGLRFFLIMLRITTFFSPFKIFFPLSVLFFVSGLAYYLYTYLYYHRFSNMSAVLFINAVLIFLMGLISEQVAQMRFERIEDDHSEQ
jgi:glycosyltransferase involved in cell wall biosynthesis